VAWFSLAGSGRSNVQDVFPEAASMAEIDHDGGLLTALVKQELHATIHGHSS
jgi:hypothetical protein